MDPLTLAVRRFLQDIELSFLPPPGAGEPAVALRLTSSASRRRTVVKALRLQEWQPETRHPVLLVEGATMDAVTTQLRGDYAALVDGLAEDGLTLEPYRDSPLDAEDPFWHQVRRELETEGREVSEEALSCRANVERLRRSLVSAGEQLVSTGVVDGLSVAVVPNGIQEPERFSELVGGLLRDVEHSSGVMRWMVFVADVPPELDVLSDVKEMGRRMVELLPREVRLDVDEPALRAHLRDLAPPTTKGPKLKEIVTTPQQRQNLEKAIGERVASQDVAATLRRLIVDGGTALGDDQHELAANKLRAARTLCRLSGLARQEATLLVMVGTAHLNAGDEMRALAAFRDAKEIAADNDFVEAQVQALLGAGGAHFAAGRYTDAEQSYAEIAALIGDQEGLQAIALEACRMQGNCHEQLGDDREACARFEDALHMAERMQPQAAHLTAYAFAGERLMALLERVGDLGGASRVRERIDVISKSPVAPVAGGPHP